MFVTYQCWSDMKNESKEIKTKIPNVTQWKTYVTEFRRYWVVCVVFDCGFICAQSFSHVQLSATPWKVARQTPLSMGFSRQEYWSGLPFPSPGVLSNPGNETASLASAALADGFFNAMPPGKPVLLWCPGKSSERASLLLGVPQPQGRL